VPGQAHPAFRAEGDARARSASEGPEQGAVTAGMASPLPCRPPLWSKNTKDHEDLVIEIGRRKQPGAAFTLLTLGWVGREPSKRYLDRLPAFRRLDDPHPHRLAFVEARNASRPEHRAMDEHVPAEVVAGDEAEAPDAVEPLDPAREIDCGRDIAVGAPVGARCGGKRAGR